MYNGSYNHQVDQVISKFIIYPIGKLHGKTMINSLPISHRNKKKGGEFCNLNVEWPQTLRMLNSLPD